MNRTMGMSLFFVAGLAGCSPTNFVIPGASNDKSAAKPVETGRHPMQPPITAGQINPNNAKEKAQALRDELERAQEHALDAADGKK